MSRVTAIAELQDVTPGAVFAATNVRIHLGYEQIEGEVLIVDNGSQVVAAVRTSDSRVTAPARRGRLSAQADLRMRGNVGVVSDVSLVTAQGGTAWVDGQARADLGEMCRYWQPRVLLASMAAMGQPALTIPIGSRPAGDAVYRIDLWGDITTEMAEDVEGKFRAATGKSIDLQINSEGGDLNAARRIYNVTASHDRYVAANVAGCALSAAVLPLLAADTRTAEHDAQVMVHQPFITTLNGEAFNAGDLRRVARDVDNETRALVAIIAARTGNDRDIVSEWVENETRLDPGQALKLGFVHQVLYDQAPRFPVARRARFAPINGPYSAKRVSA